MIWNNFEIPNNPYFYDNDVVIYNADCREILPHLPKVDLVLTDPPYGINHPTDYKNRGRGNLANCTDYIPVHDDNLPFDPSDILKLNVPTVLWGGNYYADKLPISNG